jgi:choline dehydrogenase-like flavoprotein
MQHDIKSLGSNNTIETNVCIIGSGPAGMTIANELFDSGLDVTLLESGDNKRTKQADDLNKGFLSGMLNQTTDEVRARQVGGTANHWIVKMAETHNNGFRFVPLQEMDFDAWPISKQDIDPYYEKIHHIFNLGPFSYENSEVWKGNTQGPTLTNDTIRSSVFSFCATDYFTRKIPEKIKHSTTHNLYTNATVSELMVSSDGKKVIAAKVISPDGHITTVKADTFIIASGGFGVPQLLLNSKSDLYPNGLGNNEDVVGRYYIDHSLVLNGYFKLTDDMYEKLKFYDLRDIDGVSVIGSIGLPQDLKRERKLQNLEAMLFPKPCEKNYNAFKSLQEFVWVLKNAKPMEHTLWQNVKNLVLGMPYLMYIAYQKFFNGMLLMPGLATGGWSKLSIDNLKKRYQIVELISLSEQKPKKTNRVSLSDQVDALGIPRVSVHMDWDDDDKQSILATEKLLLEGLKTSGFGEFTSYYDTKDHKLNYYSRTCHHLMGTARMGNDVNTSVVDSDCKLHGIDNCFVASSAVFPSGGYANPTMTLLALSLRLSDSIKKKL